MHSIRVSIILIIFCVGTLGAEETFDPLKQELSGNSLSAFSLAFTLTPEAFPAPSSRPEVKAPQSSPEATLNYTTQLEDVKSLLKKNNAGTDFLSYFSSDFVSVYVNGVEFNLKGNFLFKADTGKLFSVQGYFSDIVRYPSSYGDLDLYCWAQFDEQGNLLLAYPASETSRNFKIGSLTIPYNPTAGGAYAKVFFRDDGSIFSLHINDNLRLKVYNRVLTFKHHNGAGGDLFFYKNSDFRGGYLAEDTYIQGAVFPEGSYVEFWKNGKLRAVTGSPDIWKEVVEVKGILIGTSELGGGVTFSKQGELTSVYGFYQQTTLYGTSFESGQSMKAALSGDSIVATAVDLGPKDTFYQIDISE